MTHEIDPRTINETLRIVMRKDNGEYVIPDYRDTLNDIAVLFEILSDGTSKKYLSTLYVCVFQWLAKYTRVYQNNLDFLMSAYVDKGTFDLSIIMKLNECTDEATKEFNRILKNTDVVDGPKFIREFADDMDKTSIEYKSAKTILTANLTMILQIIKIAFERSSGLYNEFIGGIQDFVSEIQDEINRSYLYK